MTAAFQMKRSAPPVSPHVLAGLGLAILLCAAALAVLLLGDPERAAPRAVALVPPAPPAPPPALEIDAPAPEPEFRMLRGDEGAAEPLDLDTLAEPPAEPLDIRLPGVRPIDEGAPVRTRAELADDAEAAARGALPPAPIAGLSEPGPGGPLPVVGPDGRRPADAYKRPFQDSGQPRIALIVGGLGWNPDATRRAINELPPEVTLGFSPYAPNLQDWIDMARAAGHETVIEIPMEPFDYPQNDPGEHTLLAEASGPANIARLEWLMSRATGYFAVMNYMGGRFLATEPALTPVLSALAGRGVDMIYDGAPARAPIERAARGAGLDWAAADRALDASLAAADVQNQLAQLEAMALQNGAALGAGFAYPVVVDQVIDWAREAERRGYQLAPASAVIALRAGR